MANLVPIEDDKGNQIYIEVIPTGSQSGIKQTSKDTGVADKLTADDFKRMIRQAVMPTCQTFVDVWQELNQPLTADSAEVEFNLGFTASGNAVIMQASGQASFKVKVNWKFSPSENVNPLPEPGPIFNILPRLEGVDSTVDCESLESEIKILKEAIVTGVNESDNKKFDKIKIKIKKRQLYLTEQLYLAQNNCQNPPNCDRNKSAEEGGCCNPKQNLQLIEELKKLQSLLE